MTASTKSRVLRIGAISVFAIVTMTALMKQRDVGIARDEATYMHYSGQYAQWWEMLVTDFDSALTKESITKHFGGVRPTDGNREHPPLMKTLMGFSHRFLSQRYRVLDELTAYRVPSALAFGLLVALVWLFAAKSFGIAVGAVSAALTLLTPRLLFYSGLATFDVGVAAAWFATVYAYSLAISQRRGGVLLLGIVLGAAIATKHNAVMLPAVLLGHYAWLAYRDGARNAVGARRKIVGLFRSCLTLRPQILLSLMIAPVVLVALWPWLWLDPIHHVSEWLSFHLHHVHYNYEYLGENLNAPPFPWHIAPVTLALTVPVVTLVAAAFGAGDGLYRHRYGDNDEDAPMMLLALSAGVAFLPFLLPTTPIFGAEKHYLAVIPTLSIFAGLGTMRCIRLWRGAALPKPLRAVLAPALVAALMLASLSESRAAHPYGLTHYSSLAGGAAGGAELGMNRQFWGVAARGVLGRLDEWADGAGEVRVYSHDASPAWPWYHRFGLLDRRFVDAGREDAGIRRSELALVIHEKHFRRHDYMIWQDYGTVQPVYVLTSHGVPIVSVYRRPPKDADEQAHQSVTERDEPERTQSSSHSRSDLR